MFSTQLICTLRAGPLALPVNYRPLIHGAVYQALRADPAFSGRLHDGDGNSPVCKGFTFSPLTGNYRLDGHTIVFSGPVRLEIRSGDPRLIGLLHGAFSAGREILLNGQAAAVEALRAEDFHVTAAPVRVQMVSPAVAYRTDETRHTRFYSPAEETFYTLLAGNAKRKWLQAGRPEETFAFSAEPLFDGLPAKQFSTFKRTYITGWYGRYLLSGNPEVIDLLYQTGLGAKNPEGYGMFSLI